MLRFEPRAGFGCAERAAAPTPGTPGVSFVERTYFLASVAGKEVQLAPAVAAGQRSWQQA